MDDQNRKGLRAFISYAHQDEAQAERLEKHLSVLRHQGLISAWRDRSMLPGARFQQEIDAAIEASELVLLLTSADSLASEWCRHEAQRGMERAEAGKARVVPIILDSCQWRETAIGAFVALPTDGFPVADWGRPAKAYNDVTEGLRRICQQWLGPDLDADQAAGAVPTGPKRQPEEVEPALPPAESAGPMPPAALGPNPYCGLEAFHEDDADRFFGREKLTDALLTKFADLHRVPPAAETGPVRLLPIIGPSGSGKSSVARAGLLATLKKNPPDCLTDPAFAVLTPGEWPLQALARALAGLALDDDAPVAKRREFEDHLARPDRDGAYGGLHTIIQDSRRLAGRSVVLLVDQFEEVYALCRKEADCDAFIATLLHAASVGGGNVSVILTLRSDFLGATNREPALSRLLAQQGELVPVMDAAELEAAIAMPAIEAGHPICPATVRSLVDETEGREGALPLLQFVLTRIWEGMAAGTPPSETVRALNGVGGALAAEAARLYDSLSDSQKRIARRAFLKMTRLGEGTRDTRRRAALGEIVTGETAPEDIQAVLNVFARRDYRIITLSAQGPGERVAEVTHEALFDHWGELREWLDKDRADEQFDRKIAEAADDWDRADRPPGLLWRRPNLDLLRDFHARRGGDMTINQLEFFQASEDLLKAKRAAARRQIWRTRALAAAMTVLAVLTGNFAWDAHEKGKMAREHAQHALSEARRAETDEIFAEHMHRVAISQRERAEQAQQEAEHQRRRVEAALAHAENRRLAVERDIGIAAIAADALVRDLAGGLQDLGDIQVETARTLMERAETVFERLLDAGRTTPTMRRQDAWMHVRFGRTLEALGDAEGHLRRAEAAVAILQDLVADKPATLDWQADLSTALEELGDARLALGDLPGALAAYRESLETMDGVAQADPDTVRWQRDLSVAHQRVGDALRSLGDLEAALRSYRESHAIRERLAAADPDNVGWLRDLVVSLKRIALVALAQEDPAAALPLYEEALPIAERLATLDETDIQAQADLARTLDRIAEVRAMLGEE